MRDPIIWVHIRCPSVLEAPMLQILTLGPRACKWDLHWPVWIPCRVRVQALNQADFGRTI